jgi:hypothetical protein
MPDLLDCPFCGTELLPYDNGRFIHAAKDAEGCLLHNLVLDDEDDVVYWNMRSARPSTEAIPQGHDAWVEAAARAVREYFVDHTGFVVEDSEGRVSASYGGNWVVLDPAAIARAVAAVTLPAGGEGLDIREWRIEQAERAASLTAPASEPDKYTIDAGKIVAAAIAPDERVRVAVAALEEIEAAQVVPISNASAGAHNGKELIRLKSIARHALATLREIKP